MFLRRAAQFRSNYCIFLTRRCSTMENSERKDAKIPDNLEYENVYKFPYIRHAALLNKVKIYTAAFGLSMTPTCGMLTAAGQLSIDAVYVSAYLGIASTIAFSMLSLLTKNLIGFIYISKDDKYIKISYLDYWGKRKNKVVKVEEWVPFSELPMRKTDLLYLSPQLESHPEELKLITKLGGILDKKKMSAFLE